MASIVSQVGGYFKHYFDLSFFLSRCSINTYVGSGGPRQNFASTKCEIWWRWRESNSRPRGCPVRLYNLSKPLHPLRGREVPLARLPSSLTCSRRLHAFFYFGHYVAKQWYQAEPKVGRGCWTRQRLRRQPLPDITQLAPCVAL